MELGLTALILYRTTEIELILGLPSNASRGIVLLHRNPEGTTIGVFRCEIPDASGDLQSLYVGIYTATTGKSCTLKSKMFV